jgi:uncharacterized protein with HEPN domain
MQLEAKKFLYDIKQAIHLLEEFAASKNFDNCIEDAMRRSGGNWNHRRGASQRGKIEPGIASSMSEYQRIITFRNILIHGYAQVDDHLVWDALQTKLPKLKSQIYGLLNG